MVNFNFDDFLVEFGELEVRKTKTFVRGWEPTSGGSVASSPKISDSVIYFGSMDQNIYAVEPKTGKEIWRFATSTLTQSDIGKPYDMFEAVLKMEKTEDETKEEEKYEINVSAGLRDEYDTKNEYQVKVEYQQKMQY